MTESSHNHYDHYNPQMILRLAGFYGIVSKRMNERISKWIFGKRVLDLGCGFGDLTFHLQSLGFEARGLDSMEEAIEAGKDRYRNAKIEYSNSETLPFGNQVFDTVILKDTIHHLYEESDIDSVIAEIKRVNTKRVIIFDPNPTFILLFARKLINHIDPICSPENTKILFEKHGFHVIHESFYDILAFPLSGGYVSKCFLQNNFFISIVMRLDSLLEKICSFFLLSKRICWRYLIVVDLNDP